MATHAVTSQDFNQVVESNDLVFVDFWATWCGPCKMIGPVIEEIANEHPEIKVCKINVDEEGELSIKHGVMSIPTLMIFKNGEIAQTAIGYRPKEEIEELLK